MSKTSGFLISGILIVVLSALGDGNGWMAFGLILTAIGLARQFRAHHQSEERLQELEQRLDDLRRRQAARERAESRATAAAEVLLQPADTVESRPIARPTDATAFASAPPEDPPALPTPIDEVIVEAGPPLPDPTIAAETPQPDLAVAFVAEAIDDGMTPPFEASPIEPNPAVAQTPPAQAAETAGIPLPSTVGDAAQTGLLDTPADSDGPTVQEEVPHPPPSLVSPPRPHHAPLVVSAGDETPQQAAAFAPLPRKKAPAAAPPPPRRSLLDFEQILGVNWLAKVGVAILVIGVSFFLAWQLRQLGPFGKDVVGAVVGLVLLGAGIWGEKTERYRVLSRASIAGGWALLFFISYAAHHVTAARIVESPVAGLVLMLLVAAAMVGHTLRYRSQVVTGLAFALAFTTIGLNRADVASLSANVVLAIGFSLVVVRMRWFTLEIIGIAATYANHFLWLRPIIEPMGGELVPFPQFQTSATILILYWAIFRAAYVVRRPPEEKASVFSGLLNTVLLLTVMKYQAAQPELAFWLLLALGVVEIGLARLPNMREKRMSFIALSAIGAALITAAIPFRYAPEHVTPVWLIDAILFSAVGIITAERVYRRLGTIVLAVTTLQLLSFPAARLLNDRFQGAPATNEWTLGLICLAVALTLYADSIWLPRKWPESFDHPLDRAAAHAAGYAGSVIVLLAGWVLFPGSGTAVFWAASAVVLMLVNRRLAIADLPIHAAFLGGAAFLRAVVSNLPADASSTRAFGDISWRVVTVVAIAALLYVLARLSAFRRTDGERFCAVAGTWAATTLVTVLAWYELRPEAVALAWTAFALALSLIGRRFDSAQLTWQANAMTAIAVARVAIVNIGSSELVIAEPFTLTWRLLTVVALVTVLYLLSRWNATEHLANVPAFVIAPTWVAATLLVLVVWFEVRTVAVVLVWTLLGLALSFFGRRVRNVHLAAQANVVAAVALAHALAVDLSSRAMLFDGALDVTWRAVTLTALAAFFYLLSRWNRTEAFADIAGSAVVPRVLGTTLLMLLVWREVHTSAVVIAWSILGFALLAAGRRLRLADLVAQANGVAFAAAIRAIVVNLPANALALDGTLHLSWRLLSVPFVVALLYSLSRWNAVDAIAELKERAVSRLSSNDAVAARLHTAAPMWAASALVVLLSWYELLPASVAPAWTILAVLLLEVGFRSGSRDLLLQAAALFAAAFVRVFVVNMNIDDFGSIGARVYTIAPIAIALLYAYARSDSSRERKLLPDWVPNTFAWLALTCATALVRFQVTADAVVVAWSVLTTALLAAAAFSRRRVFLHIGLALALATFTRGVLHNLYQRSYFPSPGEFDRWIFIGAAAVILAGSLPFAFRTRSLAAQTEGRIVKRALHWLDARPEQILFFIPLVLVTVLIGTEMRSGMLTVAWGIEAVLIFVLALLVGERSYRLTGIALLLLCVGKVFVLDFWSLTLRDKALTGIVMGLALIGVSLLYTRKRETILKFL